MIYIIQRELPCYRIPFFISLSRTFDIKVLYSRLLNTSGTLTLPDHIFIKVKGYFPSSNPYFSYVSVMLRIFRNKPEVIIHEMSLKMLNVYLIPVLARITSSRLIWWGHGYVRTDKQGNNGIRRSIRILLHKTADASIVYSLKGKEFLTSNRIDKSSVFVAWNSVDTECMKKKMAEKTKNPTLKDAAVKNPPGVSFLFLGRLSEDKKPLFAVELFVRIAVKYPECSFHIVGGGVLENKLREFVSKVNMPNITFYGELTDQETLGNVLSRCDLLISPGYLGLNVVHALAFGIPVISVKDGTENTFHSPEAEYIENTKAFIALGKCDPNMFEECCIRFINERELLREAKIAAERSFRDISVERMICGFKQAIEYVLKNKGPENESAAGK